MNQSFACAQNLRHHAFVLKAGVEEGVQIAQEWAEREFGIKVQGNPDVVVLRYGLFSVEDARRVAELAAGAAFTGKHRVVIIAATRAYHEAQNALLKLFEEPPPRTFLLFIVPSLGGLLATFRSRVQVLNPDRNERPRRSFIPEAAEEFMKASREKRSAMIKKLTSGKDEEERRELRDEAVELLNGIETAAYRRVGSTRSYIGADR